MSDMKHLIFLGIDCVGERNSAVLASLNGSLISVWIVQRRIEESLRPVSSANTPGVQRGLQCRNLSCETAAHIFSQESTVCSYLSPEEVPHA